MSAMQISSGLEVQSFDGHTVGEIAKVEGDLVLIRPRRGAAYWLDSVLVRDVEPDRAILQVDRKRLRNYQPRERSWLKRPATKTYAAGASVVNVVLSIALAMLAI